MCFNCPDGTFLPDCRDRRPSKVNAAISDAQLIDSRINGHEGVAFSRIAIVHCQNDLDADDNGETEKACKMLLEARTFRRKYLFKRSVEPWEKEKMKTPNCKKVSFKMNDAGIFEVYDNDDGALENIYPTTSLEEFITDFNHLTSICQDGVVNTLCHSQLSSMEQQFKMHTHLNAVLEDKSSELGDKADFFSIGKVDTHIHLAAAFSPQDFVQFMRQKVIENSPEPVFKGKSLGEVMRDIGLTVDQLTLDVVDVQADHTLFNRFDRFNAKYNPAGNSSLRVRLVRRNKLA